MDSVTQQQLQTHCAGKDMVEVHSLSLACRFFLGIDNPERIAGLVEHFDRYRVTLGMHSIMVNLPGTTFYHVNKAVAALRKELTAVIRKKKLATAESGARMNDILSHLINITSDAGGRWRSRDC